MHRAATTAVLFAPFALAGPLDPPPGPVMPTPGPEPRVSINDLPGDATAVHIITEPGSYHITDNIAGEPGKHCVEVRFPPGTTGSVTIDFNGLSIRGGPGSLNGIHCAAAPGEPVQGINISIGQEVGGGITDTGGDGVHCENVLAASFAGLTITDTGGDAIEINNTALSGTPLTSGRKALCQWITAANVGGSGVRVVNTAGAEILNCTIDDTGGDGVNVTEAQFVNLIDSFISRIDDGVVIDDAETVTFNGVAVLNAAAGVRVTNASSFGIKEEGVKITAPIGDGLVAEDCDQVSCSGLTVVNAGGDACRVTRVSSFGVTEEGIKITAPVGDGLVVEDCPVADLSNVSVNGGTGGISLTRSAAGGYYYWRVKSSVVSSVSGSGIDIDGADSVRLEACSVSNCGGDGSTVNNVPRVRVSDSEFRDNGFHGMFCATVDTALVEDVVCAGNGTSGMSGKGGAIFILTGSLSVVGGDYSDNFADGMNISQVVSVSANGSTFTGNGAYGVRNGICDGTNFKECIIELNGTGGSGGGMLANDIGSLTLSGSVIDNNLGDGLLVTSSGGVATRFACRSNTVDGNAGRGIAIDIGSGTIVSHEMGHNLDFGVYTGPGVVATIADNVLIGNAGAINVNGFGCSVVRNTGTAGALGFISAPLPGNVVGPIVDEMNVGASCSPFANIRH